MHNKHGNQIRNKFLPARAKPDGNKPWQQKTNILLVWSLMLSGCGNGGGSAGNADKDVWTNVIQNDTTAVNSHMAIVAENHTSYDIKFIGCMKNDDQGQKLADYVEINLKDIPGGYSFPRIKSPDYAAQWTSLDHGNGIYDQTKIYTNSLYFHDVAKHSGASFACVYSVWLPELARSLNFKLTNNWYATEDYEAAKKNLNQPQIDEQLVQQQSALAAATQYGVPAVAGVAATGAAYAYFKSGNTLRDWIYKHELIAMNSYAQRFNQTIRIIMNQAQVGTPAWHEAMDFLSNELSYRDNMLNNKSGNYYEDQVAEIIEAMFHNGNNPNLHEIRVVQERQAEGYYLIKLKAYDQGGREFNLSALGLEFKTFFDPNRFINDPVFMQASPEIATSIEAYLHSDYGVVQTDLQASHQLVEIANNSNPPSYYTAELKELDRLPETPFSLAPANTLLVGVAWAAVQYFVLDELFAKFTGDPGLGQFKTGLNHLRIDPLTSSDVQAINAQLPSDQQLDPADSAKVSVLSKSSIYQDVRLSPANAEDDGQSNLELQLNTLSNPWIRYQDVGYGGKDRQDPYFGSIERGSPAVGDAAVTLSISSAKVNALSEYDYDYAQSMYASSGMTAFAGDYRLIAPAYVLSSNGDNPSVSNLWIKPGANAISGLVLNNQQTLQLQIQLPPANPASHSAETKPNQNATTLVGGGLGISYVDQDTTRALQFMPVKGQKLLNMLEAESNPPGYLYSNFGCKFPTPLGSSCPLTLKIGGNTDGKRHQGKLYLADATSHTSFIPVYINYHLVADNTQFDVALGDDTAYMLNLANYGSFDYQKLLNVSQNEISKLIPGAKLSTSSCEHGLAKGAQAKEANSSCALRFDLSQVEPGNYTLPISGLKAGESTPRQEADTIDLNLNVSQPW